MSTDHHTPHADGALLDAAVLNAPLSELDTAIGARLAAPADVATNAAKLALTGISAGHIVRITGEANRLEMYLGGAINSDANWQIIGPNTYKLVATKIDAGDPSVLTLNGVAVTTETVVGWVREGERLALAHENDLLGVLCRPHGDGAYWWTDSGEGATTHGVFVEVGVALIAPVGIQPRYSDGVLITFNVQYTAP